ncbi:hypothetical protein HT031_003474 [Scenedesmus sp. PABB004]|nr:hypothetical protein HT031_003474 [Scenedesmus sp. PABB004]
MKQPGARRLPPPAAAPAPLAVLGALSGGLLSSSCCVLQLALNATPIGCAGFSALTPWRHAFRAVTVACLAHLALTQGLNRRTLLTVALSLSLMASQGAVAAHNRGGGALPGGSALRALLARWGLAAPPAPRPPAAVRTRLAVAGVRCEACAARLRAALGALPGVDGVSVELGAPGAAELTVWSNTTGAAAPDARALAAAVRATDASYVVSEADARRECFDAAGAAAPCPAAADGGGERRARQQQQAA